MDELNSIDAQEFADTLKQVVGTGAAQKRRAVVQQVDVDGTVWVQIPGSDKLVPITGSSAAVSPGDTVSAEFRGGALYIDGNRSDPATGARHTAAAIGKAVKPLAVDIAKAQDAADEAQAVADATNQHFFADGSGVHVTEADGDATTEHNILINSLGILLRKAANHLVSITQSAIAFYDGLGNAASNIVAQFGASGAQIGKAGESHVELDYRSMQLVDKEGETFFNVSDLRDSSGSVTRTDTFAGDGETQFFTCSCEMTDPNSVTVEVNGTVVSSGITIWLDAIVFDTPPVSGSTIEVTYTTESDRAKAFTFGSRASGHNLGGLSFAEGLDVSAEGMCSHAEGRNVLAGSTASHAEGESTSATHQGAHAEGSGSQATGFASHAQNYRTKASSTAQTALGKYNEEDANGTYALIIGNGTADNARSNALAVKWNGEIVASTPVPVASGGTGTTEFGTHYAPTMGATKSVANNTWTQLHNFKLAAGKWLILAYLYAASNTTGSRQYRLTKTSTAPTTVSMDGDSLVLAGGNSAVYAVLPVFVEHSAETTYYMWATQNSGGALNMRANLTAIRLG